MSKLYFDKIGVGDKFLGEKVIADRNRMIEFAQEFDNQPMHLDRAAAQSMGLNDVIAAGSYTFSLSAKSCVQVWNKIHFLPSGLGFQMSFVKPLYAGDEIQMNIEFMIKRTSRDPSRGVFEVNPYFPDEPYFLCDDSMILL